MAAGQGFKTFVTGEVLTAGDVNGYLMQGINVFTNATARDAAITAPAEGQFAFTKDNNSLWYYDGAAWVASGAAGDIEGVTAGVGISGGGTSGTVTVTNSMATAIDAKGDLVPGTGADTFARLAVGANDTVLTADSTAATGLKWAAPAGGGSNWSLVGSAALTGASTITVSGISGADQILVGIASASSTANQTFTMRFNSDSGGNYNAFQVDNTNFTAYNAGMLSNDTLLSQTEIYLGNMSSNADSTVTGYLFMSGCNASGLKAFHGAAGGKAAGGNNQGQRFYGGFYNSASTISSVSIISGANFDAGTLYVYKTA